ncbi:MAG: hypothetical protein VX633_11900, partial [Verrucomicrobiota bacterium]|nr:hypothetical protein [Verrucomicrobiota bacterium]
MKKSVIGHACWAAVAVGAFAMGSMLDRADSGGNAGVKVPRASKSARGASGDFANGGNGESLAGSNSIRPSGGFSAGAAGGAEWSRPLSEAELEAVAKEAFRNGSPLVRRRAFDQLLNNLTAENAKDMLVHLKENRAGGEQWRDFHYLWGKLDGKAA